MKHNQMTRIMAWILIVLSMLSLGYALTGNNLVSEVRDFVVDNLPEVHLITPQNNSEWISSFNVSFKYNVTDYSDIIQNCSLYINDVWNASNNTPIVQDENMTINITLANGDYNWSVHCIDSYGSEGISETFNLSVKYEYLSISVIDALVDFGICTPEGGTGTWFDSNDTSKGGVGAGLCSNLTNPLNISVENDGNLVANVTIQVDSTDLSGGSNPELWYAIQNSTLRPGCFDGMQETWSNFTTVDTPFNACTGLNATDNFDRLWALLRFFAPSDSVPGSRSVIITFVAEPYN